MMKKDSPHFAPIGEKIKEARARAVDAEWNSKPAQQWWDMESRLKQEQAKGTEYVPLF